MNRHPLDLPIELLSTHQYSQESITEAFKSVVPSMFDFLSSVKQETSRSADLITGVLNDISLGVTDTGVKKGYTSEMNRAVAVSDYLNLGTHGNSLVYVPENFTGNLLEYSKDLFSAVQRSRALYLDTHGKYNLLLKGFLTNKGDRVSLKDHTTLFNYVDKQTLEITELTKAYFKTYSGKTMQKLGSVLKRVADIEPLFDTAVELSQTNSKENIFLIKEKVSETTDLLEMILTEIKQGKIKDVSQATTINLATGARSMGDLTKLSVALTYDAVVLIESVNKLAISINDALER